MSTRLPWLPFLITHLFLAQTLAGQVPTPLSYPGDLLANEATGALASGTVGEEFQINTYTTGLQDSVSVAVAANGDFVVVWESDGSTGTDSLLDSIQGQRYASDGSAIGEEFQINTYTTGRQQNPVVAFDADGGFVVVWDSQGSAGTDSSGNSVQAQRYASDGSAVGGEIQVNTNTTADQAVPSLAVAANGDFVVVWATDDAAVEVQGQRFASDGSAIGDEFQVNTTTPMFQYFASVAVNTEGDFVVVWESQGSAGTDSSSSSIQGQRYASDGSAVGGEFQVNAYTTSAQRNPAVAAGGDGSFVVAWRSYGSAGTDSSADFSIQGRRFASDGSAVGDDFQVNTYTTSDQENPTVAVEANGTFVVVWESNGSTGTDSDALSIQGQRFASDGSAVGGEFQINTYTTSDQEVPAASVNADGDLVVVWQSTGSSSTDTDERSVQAQRFALMADLSITKDDGVTFATPGDTLVYTLVASNAGPDAATSVSITDTFPAGLTFCEWTSFATGGATGSSTSSGDLDDTLSMPAGSSVTYTVDCDTDPSFEGVVVNTATISSSLIDSNPDNNSATDSTSVLDTLFTDSFESGDTSAWSSTVP